MTDSPRPAGWITAPLPANEAARLEALQRYQILDTLPEESFDRITRLASAVLKTPIALVSLIDGHRQWFKSHCGIDASETPRDMAFCAHAILQNDVMVVPNATQDERFRANPLVAGEPHIRFYAGAPLTTSDGYNLGTLCVIDREARAPLSAEEQQVLKDLAALVIDALELRIAGQSAMQASQAKSKFLANMSHEIRTPMNVITGYADMLMDSPLSRDQKHQLDIIKKSADALLDIINDVLDISKIEAGKLDLEQIPFNLRGLCEEVVQLFSLKAADKFLPLLTDFQNTLPARVIGDPGRLRQVLINLVGNAIKFTAQGHVKLEVRYLSETQQVQCCVEDTGIGIKPEHIDRIFQDFTQVDMSVTRQYGGTGLGLAITQRLLSMMGGMLQVKSEVGKGSRFAFLLPLPEATSAQIAAAEQAQAQCKDIRAHVLVVDDIVFNQKVASYTLEKIGCTVETANSGREALEKMQNKRYDVVFMDVQMPEMDGMETTRQQRAREEDHHQLIIAMTASALPEDREAALKSGMDDFISKPIQLHAVQSLLRKNLRKRAA